MTLTYEDNEGDAVTIAADSDVEDAVVHQKLNPLRLEVHTQAKSPAPDRVMSTNFAGYPSTEAPPSLPRPLPLLSLLGMLESVKEAEVVQEVSHRVTLWGPLRVVMSVAYKCFISVVCAVGGIGNTVGTQMSFTEP